MEIFPATSAQIFTALQQAQKILIISHRNPDADSIGSNLALRDWLESPPLNKTVDSACTDPIPENCLFIPHAKKFIQDFDPNHYDTFIAVDAGSIEQVSFPQYRDQFTEKEKTFINIDHHPSNERYGTINLVIDNAAATTLIIYQLFQQWQIPITPQRATCLLAGLYYDTGSFMHSNTSADVCEMAAELLTKNADRESIIKNLFKNHSISKLKLWGKVLSAASITKNNVAVSGVTAADLKKLEATHDDLSGLIDYLSSIKDTKFAALFSEAENTIKGSFRTRRDDIDVAAIAAQLGGGGHKKASGFSIKGSLSHQTKWRIE